MSVSRTADGQIYFRRTVVFVEHFNQMEHFNWRRFFDVTENAHNEAECLLCVDKRKTCKSMRETVGFESETK